MGNVMIKAKASGVHYHGEWANIPQEIRRALAKHEEVEISEEFLKYMIPGSYIHIGKVSVDDETIFKAEEPASTEETKEEETEPASEPEEKSDEEPVKTTSTSRSKTRKTTTRTRDSSTAAKKTEDKS